MVTILIVLMIYTILIIFVNPLLFILMRKYNIKIPTFRTEIFCKSHRYHGFIRYNIECNSYDRNYYIDAYITKWITDNENYASLSSFIPFPILIDELKEVHLFNERISNEEFDLFMRDKSEFKKVFDEKVENYLIINQTKEDRLHKIKTEINYFNQKEKNKHNKTYDC